MVISVCLVCLHALGPMHKAVGYGEGGTKKGNCWLRGLRGEHKDLGSAENCTFKVNQYLPVTCLYRLQRDDALL